MNKPAIWIHVVFIMLLLIALIWVWAGYATGSSHYSERTSGVRELYQKD